MSQGAYKFLLVPLKVGYRIRQLGFSRNTLKDLIVSVMIILMVAFCASATIRQIYLCHFIRDNSSLNEVETFLNSKDPNSTIETWDSEFFFLLDCKYHYSPHQFLVLTARKYYYGVDLQTSYNALTADPNYLVLGLQTKVKRELLYDHEIESGQFHLLKTVGPYDIYQRGRPTSDS